MKKFLIMILVLTLTGCMKQEPPPMKPADINLNTSNPDEFKIYIKPAYSKTPKFGFFITEGSLYNSINDFEQASTRHDFYGFEMNINDPFPINDVLQCYIYGKIPVITIYVSEASCPDAYTLIKASSAFGALNVPVYVNLAPFSSNSWRDINKYKEFWEIASKAFNYNAPNTTLIWSVFKEDIPLYKEAMPSESLFSLAGLNFYGSSENGDKEFLNSLNELSNITKKDLIVTSLAISSYSTKDHSYKSREAIKTIENIYYETFESFPNVVAVLYMDKDLTIPSPSNTLCNDYRVTKEEFLMEGYLNILEQCDLKKIEYYKSPFIGKVIDNRIFVDKEVFSHCLSSIPDMMEESFSHKGFVSVDNIEGYSAFQKDDAIYLTEH